MLMNKKLLPLFAAAFLATAPAHADEAELRAKLERLANEVEALKAELKALNTKTEAVAAAQEAAPAPAVAALDTLAQQTTFFGYGEVNYSRPSRASGDAQADVRRAVLGFGHRFDADTRLVAELEWEHAIVSADDQGESEVEQFYIDHRINNFLNIKTGLFLIPSGLLNQSHEPTRYFGVERNFVETAIIPTTWREGGIGLYGSTDIGLAWDVGVTTGFNLGKWDAAATEGQESPLGSIHQELQLARARDLAVYGALNYNGVPGLNLGGSVFSGGAGQGNAGFAAPDARVTLWDVHGRWQHGPLQISALYARGMISNTDALNLTFAGQPTLVPKSFSGWYTEASYRAWQHGNYAITPFARYELYNTASAYDATAQGLGAVTGPNQKVWTYGTSFNIHPQVVFKADLQNFPEDGARNRFNLGLGLMF
jgi:outer membrane murein-binding lipoprotein Lpp